MPQVLTTNAKIMCPHGGPGTSIPTNPKWSVNDGIVLLEGDTGTLACPSLLYPCIGYQLRSMGLNATQVDGRRVILASDFNQTLTGLPLQITESHQTFDNSTPAPIPSGQDAPPLSPELADTVKPVVAGLPLDLVFNSTTMLPASLIATFTLFSDYPLKWILTLINGAVKQHLDISNGLPPGLVLAPSGGDWDTPNLTVTVTMTNIYMAALGSGEHHLYMTGINQRGLSDFAKVTLTVS